MRPITPKNNDPTLVPAFLMLALAGLIFLLLVAQAYEDQLHDDACKAAGGTPVWASKCFKPVPANDAFCEGGVFIKGQCMKQITVGNPK